ncbi:hypothetical protein ROG8370_00106 [Roseovarius gaetbuli]|uniref:Uncharacterized protein n=1 Tax=Roseovarius gaetbuli TaxID=1356575 RepID=A0A1X6Y450_9RHOB|nr:hypothetical protein ROG8370_00106 [Roseovarius gaetbuli]
MFEQSTLTREIDPRVLQLTTFLLWCLPLLLP